MTPDEARELYTAEWDNLDAAADALRQRLRDLCADLGIAAEVEARAKGIGSFVKKIHLRGYSDPWREVTDKVGARIVVPSPKELRELRSGMEGPHAEDLCVRGVRDKSLEAPEDSLHYPGIHAQVTVPGVAYSDGLPIEAEVQLRTQAQDLWCVASHRLDYKGAVVPAKPTRRRLLRLSVLTEMFDQEVETAMNELAADPAYTDARYLQALEAEYLRFASEPGNDELSLEVIAIVRGALKDTIDHDGYAETLHDFVSGNTQKLQEVYRQYGIGTAWSQQFAYWLFTQPESIMVFHLIESAPMMLAEAVSGTEIESAVRNLYASWGRSMPEAAG